MSLNLRQELRVRLGATSLSDSDADALIAGAIATFETQTDRDLRTPAAGDPNVSIVVPVSGAVAKLPDARSITSIEVSASRLNPVWTPAPTGTDVESYWFDETFVYLNLPYDTTAVLARVTGKFGLFGLPTPPRSVATEVVTLAAHRKRSEGSDGGGVWEPHDDVPEQSFNRLPPSYMTAVAKWTVPDPAELRVPIV